MKTNKFALRLIRLIRKWHRPKYTTTTTTVWKSLVQVEFKPEHFIHLLNSGSDLIRLGIISKEEHTAMLRECLYGKN